jgi:preprotein translocase subunit Sec63
MPNPTEPREAEAVPVTLMRIEMLVAGVGKDVVHLTETVTDLRTEVVQHRGQIGSIESDVQQLQSDQRAAEKAVKDADKAREDTAAALEKQNALALAKAKDAVDSATRAWAPRNFAIAVGLLVIAALSAYAAFKFGGSIAAPPTVR